MGVDVMNHQKNYSTPKAISIVLRVILIALIAFAIYAFSTARACKSWDVEYPMANAHISWQQTFYGIPVVRP